VTVLRDDPQGGARPVATLVMAHGAGASMGSGLMNAFAEAAARSGLAVVRFEFAYMAARRTGARPPPPRIPVMVPEFAGVLDAVLASVDGPVVIGGKSMGSRVACRLAAGPLDRRVVGVFALGFPFHPPSDPDRTRLDDLAAATLPVLVCQGTRDPYGDRGTVSGYELPDTVEIRWFEAADHDLHPTAASGFTAAGHLDAACAALAGFARRHAGGSYSAGSKS
jgi:predicted alpha/beta-hydrolase family hydrolase